MDDLEQLDKFLTFDEFTEWLDKYAFVRNMIREALMPNIWSLTDEYLMGHKANNEKNGTFSQIKKI